MAKEIQYRLPQPQKTLTTTYSPPNPTAPTPPQRLPQPLPYDPSVATAGMRVAESLFNYQEGKEKVDRAKEEDLITRRERIRIADLEQGELEGELRKLAAEAEAGGIFAKGTNPYRIKVAMRNIADRIMRMSYGPTLKEAANRFIDPLNPDGMNEATQFALDAFRKMPIDGFWAKDHAAGMYSEMSTKWLAGIENERRGRLEAKAGEDVQDIAVRALTDYYEDREVTWDETMTRMIEGAEDGYSITRMPQRDSLAAGISQVMKQRAIVAANEGDVEDIETMLSDLDRIEEIKSGPMALSEQQAAELGDIRAALSTALERVGDQDREDIERHTQRAIDRGNTWIIEQTMKGEGLPTDLADPAVQALRDAMEDDELSQYAIDNYFAEYFLPKVNAYISGGRKPDPDELDRVLAAIGGKDVTAEARRAFIDNSTLPEVTKSELRDKSLRRARDETMIQQMLLVDPNTGGPRTSLENFANGNALATQVAIDEGGASPETAANLQTFLDEYVQNAGRKAAQGAYDTNEIRSEAVEAAISEATRIISEVRLGNGADYDINGARKHGIPEHIIQEMLEVTRSKALLDLGVERVEVPGREDAGDVALFGGGNIWHRDLFAFADNIHKSYDDTLASPTASAVSKKQAKTENDEMVVEMLTDAEVVIGEISRSFGEDLRRDPSFPYAVIEKPQHEFGVGAASYGPMHDDVKGTSWDPSFATQFAVGSSSVTFKITPQGIVKITTPLSGERPGFPAVESDAPEHTNDLIQAYAILGLTNDQMRNKSVGGLGTDEISRLRDPYRTGMIPVEGFEDALARVADTNTPTMKQEELLGKLSGNGIVEGYKAYVDMVGLNDAVGFNDFLALQLKGIGRYRLPVPDAAVLKRMDMEITDTTP